MPPMNTDLTAVFIGLEAAASPGTPVDPSYLVPVTAASFQGPQQDRESLDEMRGIAADYEDVLTRQYSQLQITQPLDFENCIPALMCGLEDEDPDDDSDPSTWTFTPGRTPPSALRTASIVVAKTDGSTASIKRMPFARPTAIQIGVDENGYASLQTTWMGRVAAPLATRPTVGAVARTVIPVDMFEVFIDDTWATLGTTLHGGLRSVSLDFTPGTALAFLRQGRPGLDPGGWYRNRPTGVCALSVNQDSAGIAEHGHFINGDLRFLRLQADNGKTGAAQRRLRIDMSVRYIETPDELARSERQHTFAFQGHLRADATAANNLLSVEVVNDLDAGAW